MVYDSNQGFGDSIYLMYVLPAVFYTITIMLAFALSHTDGKMKWSIAALIPCVIISSPMASTMTLETCVHVGTIIFALVCLNMLRYDKHTTIKLTSVTTLTAASVFSDSIFNYYITIPIVVTFVVHVLINKDFSKWRYVFAVIVGVVIAKFLALVANYFGLLNTPGLNLQHLLITRIYHLTSIFSLLASSSISTPSFSENSFLQAMR